MRFTRLIQWLTILALLTGCAAVPAPDRPAPAPARWPEGLPRPQASGQEGGVSVEQRLASLLEGGLTRSEAMEAALLNNRRLKAELAGIGLAESDLLQAGLFKNPHIRALIRFPDEDDAKANIELEGALSLSELWRLPLRKEAAGVGVEITLAEVGWTALETAVEAGRAFDRAWFTERMVEESKALAEKMEEIVLETERRREFGFSADPAVHEARIAWLEARIEQVRRGAEAASARAGLARVMGVHEPATIDLGPEHLDEDPITPLPAEEAALAEARENRPDLKAARLMVDQARKNLTLARAGVFREVELELSYERETDGAFVLGPGLSLDLPVFDRNQAGVWRAVHQIEQARATLEAREAGAREEVTTALHACRAALAEVKTIQEEIVPLREKTLEYARTYVQAMQLNRLHLLRAERELTMTRIELLRARLELKTALAGLDLSLGHRPIQH